MRKIQARIDIRLIAGIATMTAFALSPQLAQAQAPGSLTQLASPNNCIESLERVDRMPDDGARAQRHGDRRRQPGRQERLRDRLR